MIDGHAHLEEVQDLSKALLEAKSAGVRAIVAVGMDAESQRKVFGQPLEMPNEHDKPVIIHCRFSHQRALEMVMERKVKRAVFHWYTGPLLTLERILSGGYFISATPALRYSPP